MQVFDIPVPDYGLNCDRLCEFKGRINEAIESYVALVKK